VTKPLYEGFNKKDQDHGSWEHFIRFCIGLAVVLSMLILLGA
jgi:hypothetical protein